MYVRAILSMLSLKQPLLPCIWGNLWNLKKQQISLDTFYIDRCIMLPRTESQEAPNFVEF